MYFEDERDAEDAIRGIDNTPFGYEKRKLSVEWAKVSLSSFSDESYALVLFQRALSFVWFSGRTCEAS